MAATWQDQAHELVERAPLGWDGLWSVLDTAAHGAMSLSLHAQLGTGVDLAFAAIELGEARDELKWTGTGLATQPSKRLSPLHPDDDVHTCLQAIELLADYAALRAAELIGQDPGPEEYTCLYRVLCNLQHASWEFARVSA